MSSLTVFSQYGIEVEWTSSIQRFVLRHNGVTLPRAAYRTEEQAVKAAKRRAAALRTTLRAAISRCMREELEPHELAEVVRLNKTEQYKRSNSCASHNYMDANMTVMRAFFETFEREPDLETADLDLINDAWASARNYGI